MINNLKYFFRGTPDNYKFPIMSTTHLVILLVTLLGILIIIKNKDNFKDSRLTKYFKITIVTVLSIQQISLYLWYAFSGYFTIKESLPLYNCRIAIIFTILAFVTNKNIFKNVCCYWGLIGSIFALLFPSTDPFNFPHYTLVSFFIGHIFMLWASIYLLYVEKYPITQKSLRSILIFTNIYNVLIYKFNIIFSANYGYLNAPPFNVDLLLNMNPLAYTILAASVLNVSMILFYITVKHIYKNFSIEINEVNFTYC